MSDPNKNRFEERLAELAEKTKPNRRIEKVVKEDGLIVHVVKKERRVHFPYRSLLFAAVLFVLLKAAIFAQLGPDEYAKRVSSLSGGSSLEVTAAFLLDADPLTKTCGTLFATLFN